jgi:DNA polymerase (family 10)
MNKKISNQEIASLLKKTADLLEVHGKNHFKAKAFASAAFKIERLKDELSQLNEKEWEKIDGIGKSLALHIHQILTKGTFDEYDELKSITPEGILKLLDIKGLGPKKVATLWHELGIVDKESLKKACLENKVACLKGFGEKTQQTILKLLEFEFSQQSLLRVDEAIYLANHLLDIFKTEFSQITIVGQVERWMEKIEKIEFLTVGLANEATLESIKRLNFTNLRFIPSQSNPFLLTFELDADKKIEIKIHFCDESDFYLRKIELTSSENHLLFKNEHGITFFSFLRNQQEKYSSEDQIYKAFGSQFIPAEMRETGKEWSYETFKYTVNDEDIKGVLHNHTSYSDGLNTLEEMFFAAVEKGWSFFGIADHSVSAKSYAGGLDWNEIKMQHQEIDFLQSRFPCTKLYKGIEVDILNDGSLDYPPEILKLFDYVVASIHSNLNMDEEKAMNRILKAIENPYTTILGHMTGRLIGKRQGYPVNHKKIIDACYANKVVIELNANPWRLDIDWRYLNYCIEKGVIISINPDAHEIGGLNDFLYGLKLARKALLPRHLCLNSFEISKIDQVFKKDW